MYNKITLIGRLTRDPELRFTNNGSTVCNYSLAVKRCYKNSQGQYDVDFFDIVSWRKLAEISARYLKKGRMVLVEGEMQSRKYTTQEGVSRTSWEVQARDMKMLSPREDISGNGSNGRSSEQAVGRVDAASYGGNGSVSGQPLNNELNVRDVHEIDSLDFEDAPF